MRDGREHPEHEHPLGEEMPELLLGVLHRLRLRHLLRHHRSIPLLAAFSFVNGLISISLMAATALATHAPFVFPSLGPAAFLFFYRPRSPASAPRNAILGHLTAIIIGWLSLAIFGLIGHGPVIDQGMTWRRVLAVGLSLGLTSAVTVLLRAPHPPAGATTLIVALGLVPHLWQLGVLLAAVVLLVVQAFVINRLAGLPYPLWRPNPRADAPLRARVRDLVPR